MTDWRTEDQVTFADLGFWDGKTCPEYSPQTEGRTFRPSSQKSSGSRSRMLPMCLCLRREDGPRPGASTMRWEDGQLLGQYTTPSTGVFPNEEFASRLSEILEDSPHPKYNLSAKACAGILNRARKRGKKLPEILEAALIEQAGAEWRSPSRNEPGNQGGGKGILIQNEHVGALSTLNNQSVLAYPDVANTLTQRYDGSPNPDKSQGANIVCYPINTMVGTRETEEKRTTFGVGEDGDPQFTLSSAHNHAVFDFKQGAGAKAGTIGLQEECAPTLNASESGTQLAPAIVYENHMQDARHNEMGDVCETVAAHYGTGGNNQRLVVAAVGNGQMCNITMQDLANTLDTMHDQQAILVSGDAAPEIAPALVASVSKGMGNTQDGFCVLAPDKAHALKGKSILQFREDSETYICAAVDCRNATENTEVNGTLQAKEQGQNLNSNNVVRTGMVVRRLTPLECERLQGFPDHYTAIGDWIDSKGKKHKGDADSPRYKALGNSIAVGYANGRSGFWMRMVKRISAQYDRAATLGSLFDGIGGFPLAWEAVNGKGTAVWASEIEEFCVAVTKRHFPEETDDGE